MGENLYFLFLRLKLYLKIHDINATVKSFEDVLARLLIDQEYRQEKQQEGLIWVREFPDPRRIMEEIYKQYNRLGWT